ncbi:putative TPD1 protein 1-like [Salvia divinorum]|uniref:TPD1 protein 1-like n=1 Tax=Salvia divinorum TaxID=28513 RepID=A0ABD1H106_SALDI
MAKTYISIITMFVISPFTISCWVIYPERCKPGCIEIYQWASGFASLHIPKYTVQVANEAWRVKGVYDVRISCPAFASTTLINPKVFRRLDMANCLLNDGGIIFPGQVITFEYSNILPFPLLGTNFKCV